MGYLFEVVLSLKLEYDDMFYGHVVSINITCERVDKKLYLNLGIFGSADIKCSGH